MGTPVVRASGDVAIRAYGWKGIDPKEALVNVSPNYLTFFRNLSECRSLYRDDTSK